MKQKLHFDIFVLSSKPISKCTHQTLCSLTVSDQHLDEAASSTPRPGQELPQLFRDHQHQKHGGSAWYLPTRQATLRVG